MEYPTDYGWFLRMFEDMRPVSRLFKDTVEHLFKTELFPIFEIALEESEFLICLFEWHRILTSK